MLNICGLGAAKSGELVILTMLVEVSSRSSSVVVCGYRNVAEVVRPILY